LGLKRNIRLFPILLKALVRAAGLHCHGTKCPLLTAFFSLSSSPPLTFLQEDVIVGF
jgi:hypothetical protein